MNKYQALKALKQITPGYRNFYSMQNTIHFIVQNQWVEYISLGGSKYKLNLYSGARMVTFGASLAEAVLHLNFTKAFQTSYNAADAYPMQWLAKRDQYRARMSSSPKDNDAALELADLKDCFKTR